MINRYTFISFSLLIALGVFLLLTNLPFWAAACLLVVSLFSILINISFHKKMQHLSQKHFSENKVEGFSALYKMDKMISESEEKFQLISKAIENIGSENSEKKIQLNGEVG